MLAIAVFAISCAAPRADLVVRNARIYTVDAAHPWATALAVKSGRLVVVGSDADVTSWIGPRTRVHDAAGKLILPGFHDTHVHLSLTTSKRHWCDLGYPLTWAATEHAIRTCVDAAGTQPWVLISNANTAVIPVQGLTVRELDGFERERPLVIDAVHSSFANSAALRAANITSRTPDPSDGIIIRDVAGAPTGTLKEGAKLVMEASIPKQSAKEFDKVFRELGRELARAGIVSVQELTSMTAADYYADAVSRGWLSCRVRYGQIIGSGARTPTELEIEHFLAIGRRFHSRWFDANAIKIYVDGDLGDRTAALVEPYLGSTERGLTLWTQDALDRLAARFDAAGMQLHFHAVGDRAIRMALDAIEHARRVNGTRDARHQIAHLHLVATEDLPRFAQLGVVANVQPYFATNIEYNTRRALELLGAERHRRMFRFADLRAQGARVVASSDMPVSPVSPLVSFEAAVTRRERGIDAPAFLPEQRLSLPEVIEAFTLGGAYANFLDRDSGSLEVGKFADFVMLDQNLFVIEPDRIDETKVLWTVIEGREVYRAPQ